MIGSRPLTCPYCNAVLPGAESPGVQGDFCPRCGEALPGRQAESGAREGPALHSALAEPGERRRNNRWLAGGILGGMLLLAGISLLVGLKTVPGRRALDPKQPLGYLP